MFRINFTKKNILTLILLIITFTLFTYYFVNNRDLFKRIADLSIPQLLLIITGQVIIFLTNAYLLFIIVRLANKKLPFSDSTKVTAYSSLINYFGFLQGGLGFRGYYLKRYLSISYKKYIGLTLLQYSVLFGISSLMVGIGLIISSDIQTVALVLSISAILICLIIFTTFRYRKKSVNELIKTIKTVHGKKLLLILLVTILQLCGSALAYGVELSSVGANLTLAGLFIYTGISQFSLIFALTPGGIGIREGLLIIVQSQMLLKTSDIVLASTIDRASYFIVLVIFVPFAISAKRLLGINTNDKLAKS